MDTTLNRLQFRNVANNQGNFSKTVANKMFVTQICIPTQERGNEKINWVIAIEIA